MKFNPAGGVDYDGDNTDELAILYDYGNTTTGLWLFKPAASGYGAPQKIWVSGAGGWEWSRSKTIVVDYNGDGKTELAVLYDHYGSANTGLWLFKPTASGYGSPRRVWLSGNGNWDWIRSKITAVDYNGDGKTELAVLYDYGNTAGLWLFKPTAAGYSSPQKTWSSGGGNWDWTRSKITAVDLNKDGRSELAVLYDYGNASSGLWLFRPTASGYGAPQRTWYSGGGNWDWTRSKITAVDANSDGRTELAVFYNYGNAASGLWLFRSNGSGYTVPQRTWYSGGGNWDWTRSKITAVDANGDGRTELAVLYSYGNAASGLWLFGPNGSGYTAPQKTWFSGGGKWDWDHSQLAKADSFEWRDLIRLNGLTYIVGWLDAQVGKPYIWGGGHPGPDLNASGYDCSGFVSAALHIAGYSANGTTYTLINQVSRVSHWEGLKQPVALGFVGDISHVGISILGRWWEATPPSLLGTGAAMRDWDIYGIPVLCLSIPLKLFRRQKRQKP